MKAFRTLKSLLFTVFFVAILPVNAQKVIGGNFCNPLNLNYRFQLDEPSRREAADPSMVLFKGKYYLFASKSGGYWVSDNLNDWKLISTNDLPLEDYAPTALVMNNAAYFMALNHKIYKSENPLSGKWQVVKDSFGINTIDPCLFLDEDGRLYLYYGLSTTKSIKGIELSRNTFEPIGNEVFLYERKSIDYGWQRTGDYNTELKKPVMEGAWMTKHAGKYYLQVATPGTQYKSYADALYIGESPLGPYKVADNNPFSYKPEGFICSAGHGSTFQDKFGNYWHIASMLIGINHRFERRLGMWSAFFDTDGTFYTYTAYGDFPHDIPQRKISSPEDYQPSAMLLSYNKPVEVSSALENHPKEYATNEDIQNYWSAKTGNPGEWMLIDLQKKCSVSHIQVNFAEEGSVILGQTKELYYQYQVECSTDKQHWQVLVDKKNNKTDIVHDFMELEKPVKTRFIRITNYHVPAGKFAISGFRIFGKAAVTPAPEVQTLIAERDKTDKRNVKLTWQGSENTVGYTIRYGTQPYKLYLNYQTFNKDSLSIHSLNAGLKYYFAIDSFNEKGITKGAKIISMD